MAVVREASEQEVERLEAIANEVVGIMHDRGDGRPSAASNPKTGKVMGCDACQPPSWFDA